jgi:hypothetical protein
VGAVSSSVQAVPVQSDKAVVAFISTHLNSDPVAWVSFIGKEFAWRGDSIASLISQVIGKQSIDRSKLEKMLGLLREAFARPAINRNAGDQNPVAPFALLDQLQQDLSWDASALAEIDSTGRYVIAALKTSVGAEAVASDASETLPKPPDALNSTRPES